MKIIDGIKIAQKMEADLKLQVRHLKKNGITPCLAILVFDDDRAGQVYTKLKAEAAERIGIKILTSNTDKVIDQWNRDDSVHGILVQRPGYRGPAFENYWNRLAAQIAPQKDVDGLRIDSKFIPATVTAVEKILPYTKSVSDRGSKQYIIVGRGMIGRALAKRLGAVNISSHDKNLAVQVLAADVLISACGRAGIIKKVKPGAAVIDVGWSKGDVDFETVKTTAGAVTPVPGGVGPVTVVCLLENLVRAVYNRL